MDPVHKKTWGPLRALFLGFAIYLGGQIIAALILNVFAELTGSNLSEFLEQNTIVANFMGSLLLSSIIVFLVYRATKNYGSWEALKLGKFKKSALFYVLPALLIYVTLSGILYALSNAFFPAIDLMQDQDVGFESASSALQIAVAFIALVIVAPISEEILFRGYTFQGLSRGMHWLFAAIISSALFGLAHGQLNVGIDTFAMGIAACWVLMKTGSLWPAILLHAIKNSIAFYFLFFG